MEIVVKQGVFHNFFQWLVINTDLFFYVDYFWTGPKGIYEDISNWNFMILKERMYFSEQILDVEYRYKYEWENNFDKSYEVEAIMLS